MIKVKSHPHYGNSGKKSNLGGNKLTYVEGGSIGK